MQVLIPGVGGATASMALKIALAAKAQVVVTSSSQQKIDAAKEMGALGGISYKQPDWPYAAMKLLPEGKRVREHLKLSIMKFFFLLFSVFFWFFFVTNQSSIQK